MLGRGIAPACRRPRPGWRARPGLRDRNAPARRCAACPCRRCGAGGERRRAVALAEGVVGQKRVSARERVIDRDAGRSDRDLDLGEPRGAARLLARLRDDREQRPARGTRSARRRTADRRRRAGCTSFLPGMSAAVSTATTPGAARTASRSTPSSCPAATGAPPTATCSVPSGSRMSSMKLRRARDMLRRGVVRAARGAPRAAATPRRGGQAARDIRRLPEADDRGSRRVDAPPISVSALRSRARATSSAIVGARAQVVDRREVLAPAPRSPRPRPPARRDQRLDQRLLGRARALRDRRHAAEGDARARDARAVERAT